MVALIIGASTALAVVTFGATVPILAAAAGATINLTTTYIGAKITGQSYSLTDGLVAAGAGAINAIPGCGPALNGLITGSYTACSNYQNGASWQGAVISGLVAGTASTLSISNLSNLGNTSLSTLMVTSASDLTFGAGANFVSAAVSESVRPITET